VTTFLTAAPATAISTGSDSSALFRQDHTLSHQHLSPFVTPSLSCWAVSPAAHPVPGCCCVLPPATAPSRMCRDVMAHSMC